MPISKSEVKYTADLARIKLNDEELEILAVQLQKIVDFIDKLKALDISEIEPTSHVLPIHNVFRQDELTPSLKTEDTLKNAPSKEGNFFKVPKVID